MPEHLFLPFLNDVLNLVDAQLVAFVVKPSLHGFVGHAVKEIHADDDSVTLSVSADDPLEDGLLIFVTADFPVHYFFTSPVPLQEGHGFVPGCPFRTRTLIVVLTLAIADISYSGIVHDSTAESGHNIAGHDNVLKLIFVNDPCEIAPEQHHQNDKKGDEPSFALDFQSCHFSLVLPLAVDLFIAVSFAHRVLTPLPVSLQP